MKLIHNAGAYKVVLPKAIVEMVMKWETGIELELSVDGDKITLRRKDNERNEGV